MTLQKPEVPKRTVRLFVYGSLKRGFPLHSSWLKDQEFVGPAELKGFSLLSLGAYPGLISVNNDDFSVIGEVFNVVADTFEELKDMEESVGYSTVEVELADKTTAYAFVFDSLIEGPCSWVNTTRKIVVNGQERNAISGRVDPVKNNLDIEDFVDDDLPF